MFRVIRTKHMEGKWGQNSSQTKASGFVSPADDFIEPELDLNKLILQHPSASFFMKVESSNYKQEGVYPGDLLVVDRSFKPKSGSIVIITHQGEFKLMRASHKLAELEHTFWGVVTYNIRKLVK